MTKTKFSIHPFESDPTEGPLYAIIPDDLTPGWVIGELDDVQAVADRLNKFLSSRRHDGEIDEFDERLGATWLDIADAVLESERVGLPVAAKTIRTACARKQIVGAQLDGKTWRFSRVRFLSWLRGSSHQRGRPSATLERAAPK